MVDLFHMLVGDTHICTQPVGGWLKSSWEKLCRNEWDSFLKRVGTERKAGNERRRLIDHWPNQKQGGINQFRRKRCYSSTEIVALFISEVRTQHHRAGCHCPAPSFLSLYLQGQAEWHWADRSQAFHWEGEHLGKSLPWTFPRRPTGEDRYVLSTCRGQETSTAGPGEFKNEHFFFQPSLARFKL